MNEKWIRRMDRLAGLVLAVVFTPILLAQTKDGPGQRARTP